MGLRSGKSDRRTPQERAQAEKRQKEYLDMHGHKSAQNKLQDVIAAIPVWKEIWQETAKNIKDQCITIIHQATCADIINEHTIEEAKKSSQEFEDFLNGTGEQK